MKKILLLIMALMLLLTACKPGKGEDETSQGTETGSELTHSQAEDSRSTTKAEEIVTTTNRPEQTTRQEQNKYTKESFFKDYPLFAEKTFIGQPVKNAIAKYGSNYEQGGYSGSWTVMYDDIVFLVEALEEFNEEQPITHIIVYGQTRDPRGESYGKTFTELKEIIPDFEEPSYDLFDDSYGLSINVGSYGYLFTWSNSDYKDNDFVSVLIGRPFS